MIKRLIFVTGFGVGFVVGSASGRKSYEALKQNAVKTWHDPKVQEKVSEGTDWVKSEVPVVGWIVEPEERFRAALRCSGRTRVGLSMRQEE